MGETFTVQSHGNVLAQQVSRKMAEGMFIHLSWGYTVIKSCGKINNFLAREQPSSFLIAEYFDAVLLGSLWDLPSWTSSFKTCRIRATILILMYPKAVQQNLVLIGWYKTCTCMLEKAVQEEMCIAKKWKVARFMMHSFGRDNNFSLGPHPWKISCAAQICGTPVTEYYCTRRPWLLITFFLPLV